mgnify:FL=1
MKYIGILGSTGSVGRQALEVIKENPNKFKVKYLSCNRNFIELIKQINFFKPTYVSINTIKRQQKIIEFIKSENINCEVLLEKDLINKIKVDIVLNAISGYEGLEPTINIIKTGTDIALSNKESIVQAGHIVMKLAKKNKVNIFPVDSEHSAIWQCLIGENKDNVKRLILTASGGPFRKLDKSKFSKITKEQALNHPNWSMGDKISIDSATMMNKGFELIEAYWLFGINLDKIDIIVHPQSLIHSMVEYIDGSIKAQISSPDMKLPIQYAFSYPERYSINDLKNDLESWKVMNFERVDLEKFKCIKLAYKAIKLGGSYPTVLNVSNDIAVDLFLNDKVSFEMIPNIIEKTMNKHKYVKNPDLLDIKDLTNWTKKYISNMVKSI